MSSDATRPEDEHRSPSLVSLAQGFGISTEYYSFFGDLVQVPAATLRSVLSAMGVATFTDAQIDQALLERDLAPWRALVPPSLVIREASPVQVLVHVAADGGLGEGEFFGRRAEVKVARHGQKGAQVAHGNGAGAQERGRQGGVRHGGVR